MSAKPLRHGILGTAFMATVHARAVRASGGVVTQGYQDCFNAFVADVLRAADGEDVEGLPTFTDGVRAARITDAVVRSARSREWVEVAA